MGLIDELETALEADAVAVGVGKRPTNTGDLPFVVLWPDAPTRSAHTVAASNAVETVTIVAHCLGLSVESAGVAERKLAAAVYGLYGAVVDGAVVLYPEQLQSLPLSRDDDVRPPLYDLVVEWRLRTTPST